MHLPEFDAAIRQSGEGCSRIDARVKQEFIALLPREYCMPT